MATHLIEMSNSWTRRIADADALIREIAQAQELAGIHIAPNPPGFSAIQDTGDCE